MRAAGAAAGGQEQDSQASPAPQAPGQQFPQPVPDRPAEHPEPRQDNVTRLPAAAASPPGGAHTADVTGSASVEQELQAIRAEGLTGRQLRMARRVAQKQGIKATSDLDAVRLLRKQGIDPFKRSTTLELVTAADTAVTAPAQAGQPGRALSVPGTNLPPSPAAATPPPSSAAASRMREVADIQRDIARRRHRRMSLLLARLVVFVFLPTLLAGYYFYKVATPLFATHAEFVIQQAEQPGMGGSGLGGLFSGTSFATSQDSITVQSYLQSREAMRRLDDDHGFKAHFSQPHIDPIRRLDPDATDEAAYRLYQRNVKIGYDPTEGIIRLEVIAADPETSERFSRALITYAEEQVDQLTQRLRADQMQGARQSFEEAEEKMLAAQMRVVELQERFEVLSSDIEVSLLTQQIAMLDQELTRERLTLQELLFNPRPNPARVDPLQRRIANLEAEIASLRANLTQGREGGTSLARIQSELVVAEADVATRQLLMSQSLQQLEAARIEANRQVRYLSMGVSPIAPDEPTYPRAFENTALALMIFGGIYLLMAMTASILREQV